MTIQVHTAAECVDACKKDASCAAVVVVSSNATHKTLRDCVGPDDRVARSGASMSCEYINRTTMDTYGKSDVSTKIAETSSWAADGILTSTVQPWRDQSKVAKYFEAPTHTGADPYGWEWELATSQSLRHRVTGAALRFRFRVAANGTVLAMVNVSASPPVGLAPLMQFVREGPAQTVDHTSLKTDDDTSPVQLPTFASPPAAVAGIRWAQTSDDQLPAPTRMRPVQY